MKDKNKAKLIEGAKSSREMRTREQRIAAGKALRAAVPRESHAKWKSSGKLRDPIDVLEKSNEGRLPELVPIRYGRMVQSPFTFLRGSAALMAYDLANTPVTGIRVQACGDCHLLNFGIYATAERNVVFDINDFDETLPAPWEWDLKRLCISFVVAGRDGKLSDRDSRAAAVQCARSYRERLREYSKLSPLEVWYTRLDEHMLIANAADAKAQKLRKRYAEKARERVAENLFPKIVAQADGKHRLVDQPPFLFHVAGKDFEKRVRDGLKAYRDTLPDERRHLLDCYRLHDFALKVVGVGSVGTRCYVALAFSDDSQPLLLQVKEARHSVLEPYAGKCKFENQGERVVVGQRLMQSSSDIFLGWVHWKGGNDFYVRQLRDMKMSVPVEGFSAEQLLRYGDVCGWALARSHAKSGDSKTISGYLGKSRAFEKTIGELAVAYADQNDSDHAALVKAVRSGRVKALREDEA